MDVTCGGWGQRATTMSGRARSAGGLAGFAILVAIFSLPLTADGAPAANTSKISITADAVDIDVTNNRVTATGRVRVSDGTVTATAGVATVYHPDRRAILSNGAKVSHPEGTLQAVEIVVSYTASAITRIAARGNAALETRGSRLLASSLIILPNERVVTGEGGVTFSSPPDITATGRRLTYDWGRATVVLDGEARVQNREGFISGARIEADQRGQRATASGPVRSRFRDIEVQSRSAEVYGQEKKAVFLGDVRVTQPGRVLTTEKVTVWYGTRRVVAEGQTRVEIEPRETRR